jgi:hypothetical protein
VPHQAFLLRRRRALLDKERVIEVHSHHLGIELLQVVLDVLAKRLGPDPVPVQHLNKPVDPTGLELLHDPRVDVDLGNGLLALGLDPRSHPHRERQGLHTHVHQKPRL